MTQCGYCRDGIYEDCPNACPLEASLGKEPAQPAPIDPKDTPLCLFGLLPPPEPS